MKQFIVIDQLCFNEYGTLVCRKPSGRPCQQAHFKQGDLDSAPGVYLLAMVFNVLNVFESENICWKRDEHDRSTAEWKLIRSLNNQSLYSNGLNLDDIVKMVEQTYSKYVTINHTGKKAGITLKVKECLDNNLPVILQISYDQYESQWIVAVGYAIDKEGQMMYLLTLDSRNDSPKGRFWNGVLNLNRCTTHKYGFQYLTDTVNQVSLDDAIIIKKKR